jgi:small subunit ribosomal protein S8
MTMTDPLADMLTRIRNANVAMHDNVRMPSSKLKEALASILEREGYIQGFHVQDSTGWPGRGRPVDQSGPHDRPRGAPASSGRRGPLLRVVRS